MMQKDILLEGEGDAWLERNCDKLGQHDPVSEMIEQNGIKPTRILEVGCSNGWRLSKLRDQYDCLVYGIDPSATAIHEATKNKISSHQTTADALPFDNNAFDLVIYGFCLYLTDPEDWLRIAAEGDRVLQPGGHLIIHDFDASPPWFARRYKHDTRVLSYHFDFANLWQHHPRYSLRSRKIHSGEMISSLYKGISQNDSMEVRE